MKTVRNQIKYFGVAVLVVSLVGCSGGSGSSSASSPAISPSNMVVKSRAVFQLSTGPGGQAQIKPVDYISAMDSNVRQSVTNDVTVVNSPSSTLVLDNSAFVVPAVSNGLLDFGNLTLADLSDNDLDLCVDGATHCGTAMILMYTTGTAGDGLYNSAGGYGIPIYAGQVGGSLAGVGLDVANAAIMQSITIPANQHVMHLSDFVTPSYNVQIDFSNAGAGTYSTTIVLEYVLAP